MSTAANVSALILTLVLVISCGKSPSQRYDTDDKVSTSEKDTCDGPDADINCCFQNMPLQITNIMNIADANEPGERMVISGQVVKSDGVTPYPGLLIYAYHTDDKGYYSKKGNETGFQKWHGHLHGWCRTDGNGRYEIHSVKPVKYPSNNAPAHIHAAMKKTENSPSFYINDFVFKDDPLVNESYTSSLNLDGGLGVVELVKSADGILRGERKIVLEK